MSRVLVPSGYFPLGIAAAKYLVYIVNQRNCFRPNNHFSPPPRLIKWGISCLLFFSITLSLSLLLFFILSLLHDQIILTSLYHCRPLVLTYRHTFHFGAIRTIPNFYPIQATAGRWVVCPSISAHLQEPDAGERATLFSHSQVPP